MQSGLITVAGLSEYGFGDFYAFGSRCVARGVNAGGPNSLVSMVFQAGGNSSQTLPIRQHYGGSITSNGLIGGRSCGSIDMSAGSRSNPNPFARPCKGHDTRLPSVTPLRRHVP